MRADRTLLLLFLAGQTLERAQDLLADQVEEDEAATSANYVDDEQFEEPNADSTTKKTRG